MPSGIVAGANQGSWWDRLLMLGALLGVCIPSFWLSLNFIYLFAVRLGWLPAAGYASIFTDPWAALRYMVLPAVSLGFNQSALIARIARSCMVEVLQQDYIRTARAKGLSQRVVVLRARVPQRARPRRDGHRRHHRDPDRRRRRHGDRLQHPRAGPPHHLGHPAARLSRWCRGSCWSRPPSYVLINLAVDMLYAFIDPADPV